MKTKILKHAAFLLILAGCFYSCTDDVVTDPEKAILGKWELVLLTRNGGKDEVKHTPAGYIEYLPDGLMRWYDYATKEYTLFEGKYWLTLEMEDYNQWWDLHYQNAWIERAEGTGYYLYIYDYPDKPLGFNFTCTFISNNQIGLYDLDVWSFAGNFTYVYKRKK